MTAPVGAVVVAVIVAIAVRATTTTPVGAVVAAITVSATTTPVGAVVLAIAVRAAMTTPVGTIQHACAQGHRDTNGPGEGNLATWLGENTFQVNKMLARMSDQQRRHQLTVTGAKVDPHIRNA